MTRRLQFTMLLLVTLGSAVASAQEATAPRTYRVQLIVKAGDDAAAVARGLAATYGGRLESPVGPDQTVPMTIDESVLELLGRDPRVQRLQAESEPQALVPQRVAHDRLLLPSTGGAPRLESQGTAVPWTTGTYAYDAAGNITGTGDDRFVYDVYSRIKSGTAAGGTSNEVTQQYAYDRWGNLTSIQTGTTTIPLTVASATNRLTAVNGTTVSYDDAGEVVQYGSLSYTYDGTGMMTSSGISNVPSALYLYTPGDERMASVLVSGTVEISSSWSFRDGFGRVLRRFDRQKQSSQWTWLWRQDYIYNGMQMLAAENDSSPKIRHYHADHLGTPRVITDGGGMLIGLHTYFPYGGELSAAASGINDNQRFTGHERDASGLDYMHARYYNWGWGRFLSVDPARSAKPKAPQSWNRYSYAADNPLKYVDRNGQYYELASAADRKFFVDAIASGTNNKAARELVMRQAGDPMHKIVLATGTLRGTFTYGDSLAHGPFHTTAGNPFPSSVTATVDRGKLEMTNYPNPIISTFHELKHVDMMLYLGLAANIRQPDTTIQNTTTGVVTTNSIFEDFGRAAATTADDPMHALSPEEVDELIADPTEGQAQSVKPCESIMCIDRSH